MTDLEIIQYIDQMCVKNGEVEVKNIRKDGTYTLIVPVFNGELNEKQIATLEMEYSFDGEEVLLHKFPKQLLSAEDYIFITELIESELLYDVEHQKPEPIKLSEFRIPEEAIAVARKMLDPECSEPYYQLRPQFMERISTDVRCFLDIDYEAAAKRIPAPEVLDGKDYVTVYDPGDNVVAVISRDEVLHKEDFAALMKTAGMEATEENFNKVWMVLPDNIPVGSSLTDIALAAIQASTPEAELEFIFDDEIEVSDDMTKLEGYVWAMSSLVSRLDTQELQKFTLEEDQFMENINFYPVYDVLNGTISLEGHYYLEDAHYARGRGFTLPLTSGESNRLISAFESYCKQREGKSCLEFLNQIREQEGLECFPRRSLDDQIEDAFSRAENLPSIHKPIGREKINGYRD